MDWHYITADYLFCFILEIILYDINLSFVVHKIRYKILVWAVCFTVPVMQWQLAHAQISEIKSCTLGRESTVTYACLPCWANVVFLFIQCVLCLKTIKHIIEYDKFFFSFLATFFILFSYNRISVELDDYRASNYSI